MGLVHRISRNLHCPRITTGYYSRTTVTNGAYLATRAVVNRRSHASTPWPVSTACRSYDTGGVQAAPAQSLHISTLAGHFLAVLHLSYMAAMSLHLAPSIVLPAGPPIRPDSPS